MCTGYATVLFFSLITACTAGVINSTVLRNNGKPRDALMNYRIVGGHSVDIGDYPYQVSVEIYGPHACGGSIISEEFILTAAHCFIGINKKYVTVRAGSSFRNSGGQVSEVSKIFKHPQFDPVTYDYDVAILQLSQPLIFDMTVGQVSLPSSGTIISDGLLAEVTGWGILHDGGPMPDQLQEVDLPTISRDTCETYYPGQVTDRMFCAGFDEGGKDACQGDSGGPLVVSGIVIGITSWGGTCAAPKQPGAYTNVPAFRPFIDSIINA